MNKVRMQFIKGDKVKYISHLDLMRAFHRAFRRAQLPISYSQGFNPHPLVSFALPLAVGATSEAEYMDVELDEKISAREIMDRLNAVLPDGIKIVKAREQSEYKNTSFNDIALAEYIVKAEPRRMPDNIAKFIEDVLKQSELIVEKQGKKGMKQVNIRDDIHELSIENITDNNMVLKMKLSAGNVSNVRPDLVLSALEKYIDGFEVEFVQVHRTAQYFKDGNNVM